MWCPVEQVTVDGYDMQFGTNVLGHFFLTELLMPALIEGAKSMPDKHARVVTTSSSGAYFDTLHYDSLREADLAARKKRETHSLYFQSKFVSMYLPFTVTRTLSVVHADRLTLSLRGK